MYLQYLDLQHYRNYDKQELHLNKGINVLQGSNGQGKTNLLEAIYYLACGGNFRGNKDPELIQWNQPYFRIYGQLKKETSERLYELEVYFDQKKKKQLKINGVKYKNLSELQEYLRVVLFSPDDLRIIKGAPSDRRHYLDMVMCQQERNYPKLIKDYERIVSQRNNLLKEIHYHKPKQQELDIWNMYLAEYGSHIIYRRLQFLKKLIPIARKVQRELTEQTEKFTVTYHCSIGAIGDFSREEIRELFFNIIKKRQGEEVVRGTTLWGPHRDDLIFYLNGTDLKKYGSQGQQRTGILSLKMAELTTFYNRYGEYPLLLLDDVMSELDESRRKYLMQMVKKNEIQTIITGTNIEFLTEKIADNEIYSIKEGKIIKTQ